MAAFLPLIPLLTGNRWPDAPRSFYAAWDQGHLLVFALWTALLWRGCPRLTRRRPLVQLAVALSFAFVCGGLAEILQTLAGGGPPSPVDMRRNLIGAMSGWVFASSGATRLSANWRWCLRLTAGLLITVSLLPLARALVDEHSARRHFPVLAAFEQPFELDRWSGGADFAVTMPPFAPHNTMLEIRFLTDLYSGVALNHFPRDWRGYGGLAFSTYNPDPEPLKVVCRINDRRHNREGNRYQDRFNRTLTLSPGWSHVRLSMDEIAGALASRRMDLDDILQVGIFTVSLPTPRRLYLDDLRLLPLSPNPVDKTGS